MPKYCLMPLLQNFDTITNKKCADIMNKSVVMQYLKQFYLHRLLPINGYEGVSQLTRVSRFPTRRQGSIPGRSYGISSGQSGNGVGFSLANSHTIKYSILVSHHNPRPVHQSGLFHSSPAIKLNGHDMNKRATKTIIIIL
jgi:hypothetical protein